MAEDEDLGPFFEGADMEKLRRTQGSTAAMRTANRSPNPPLARGATRPNRRADGGEKWIDNKTSDKLQDLSKNLICIEPSNRYG